MKVLTLIFCISILAVVTFNANAGKPTRGCSDVPVTMTFVAPATGTAALSNDDPSKVYQNGVDGIANEVIHFNNDCNGSRDATIKWGNGPKAKRKLRLQFPNAVPGSLIQGGPPSFAGGASFLSFGFLNIRNLTGYTVIQPGVAATYYTRATFNYITGPDGASYRLSFYPDDYACPTGQVCVPDFTGDPGNSPIKNQPVETAWVKITYVPRDMSQPWSSTNTDEWIVEGTLTTAEDPVIQRGTLILNDGSFTHYGQYSMPFKILITAQTALPQ
jgi:hypothetical protein